jgi:deferrochelatase/peroxidase EfeB
VTVALDLQDIQGNLLRGYGYRHARHFALGVKDAAQAKTFIAGLICGDEQQSPQISTEEEWKPKYRPPYRLNLGLTWEGLGALGVPAGALAAFPQAFREGPAKRALQPDPDFPEGVGLGDCRESAPGNWVLGGAGDPDVHMLLSLYTDEHEKGPLERLSKRLRKLFGPASLTEILAYDADALPERRVHFGYRDGIAQPHIRYAPGRERPDKQPEAEPGDFLLGRDYKNLYGGNYLGDIPAELGDNASYAAFRILQQDVAGFEALLAEWASRYSLPSAEFVAAKLMGRWRNGVPLTLSPQTEHPQPQLSEKQLNDFDYAPAAGHTTFLDDAHGTRCPIGAHIRRLNPRSSLVMGQPHSRRLIRRGMPYGPPFEQADEQERGLVGIFICGDLELQYEFILRVWANEDLAAHGLHGTREAIIGAQPPGGGAFLLRTEGGRDPIVMIGLARLVQTRGSVYCLIPGIGGLRSLAASSPTRGGGS